jgi:hypothetical protein
MTWDQFRVWLIRYDGGYLISEILFLVLDTDVVADVNRRNTNGDCLYLSC